MFHGMGLMGLADDAPSSGQVTVQPSTADELSKLIGAVGAVYTNKLAADNKKLELKNAFKTGQKVGVPEAVYIESQKTNWFAVGGVGIVATVVGGFILWKILKKG